MTFRGWPDEALEFFEGLEVENTKAYWQRNKAVYESAVRAPMEELLAELEPGWGPAASSGPTGTSASAPTSPPTRRTSVPWSGRATCS
jgi:uncharacterized protein (DUF2461 family)